LIAHWVQAHSKDRWAVLQTLQTERARLVRQWILRVLMSHQASAAAAAAAAQKILQTPVCGAQQRESHRNCCCCWYWTQPARSEGRGDAKACDLAQAAVKLDLMWWQQHPQPHWVETCETTALVLDHPPHDWSQ